MALNKKTIITESVLRVSGLFKVSGIDRKLKQKSRLRFGELLCWRSVYLQMPKATINEQLLFSPVSV